MAEKEEAEAFYESPPLTSVVVSRLKKVEELSRLTFLKTSPDAPFESMHVDHQKQYSIHTSRTFFFTKTFLSSYDGSNAKEEAFDSLLLSDTGRTEKVRRQKPTRAIDAAAVCGRSSIDVEVQAPGLRKLRQTSRQGPPKKEGQSPSSGGFF